MKVLLAGRLRYQNEDHDDHHHDDNHISHDNHHHFYDNYHRFLYDNLNDNNWVTTWKTKSCLWFKTVLMRLCRRIMLHGQH